MTAREALAEAVRRLKQAGVPDAQSDARKLLIAAAKVRHFHDVDLDLPLDDRKPSTFEGMVAKREARVPMSQILGQREFYGRVFKVNSDVLDPRPDTETLIEVALRAPFERVLDLGTGTSAILTTLLKERPDATGVGTDVSLAALAIADENVGRLGVKKRCELVRSDWFKSVEGKFDLIVSNPPYIALSEMDGLQPEVRDYEPHIALTDGSDGLSCYRSIIEGYDRFLLPGGRLIVEVGPTQAVAVGALMSENKLGNIEVFQDLDGRERVVVGRKSSIS